MFCTISGFYLEFLLQGNLLQWSQVYPYKFVLYQNEEGRPRNKWIPIINHQVGVVGVLQDKAEKLERMVNTGITIESLRIGYLW